MVDFGVYNFLSQPDVVDRKLSCRNYPSPGSEPFRYQSGDNYLITRFGWLDLLAALGVVRVRVWEAHQRALLVAADLVKGAWRWLHCARVGHFGWHGSCKAGLGNDGNEGELSGEHLEVGEVECVIARWSSNE